MGVYSADHFVWEPNVHAPSPIASQVEVEEEWEEWDAPCLDNTGHCRLGRGSYCLGAPLNCILECVYSCAGVQEFLK
jgi:hypothetical protein